MDFFIRHPYWAFFPGLILVIPIIVSSAIPFARSKTKIWPLALTATFWFLYACWEVSLIGSGMNIRVDLLLIYPVLLFSTIGSVLYWSITLLGSHEKNA